MDTSVSVTAKRGRAAVDAVENLDGPSRNQDEQCRANDLHSTFVADKEAAKEHDRRRNPELKSRLDVIRPSVAGGVGAPTSAWVAEECNRNLGGK